MLNVNQPRSQRAQQQKQRPKLRQYQQQQRQQPAMIESKVVREKIGGQIFRVYSNHFQR